MKTIFITEEGFEKMNYYQTKQQAEEDADMQHENGSVIIELRETDKYVYVNNKLVRIDENRVELKKEMTPEFIKDVMETIEYLWKDEEKHWQESDKPKKHIFNTIKRLRFFLANK